MGIEKYIGTTYTATKYTRCKYVSISNPLGQNPLIEFQEELVTKVDNGESIREPMGSISEELTQANANTSFPLVDPETLQPLGQTMTYLEVNVIIRSLYAFMAARRDG